MYFTCGVLAPGGARPGRQQLPHPAQFAQDLRREAGPVAELETAPENPRIGVEIEIQFPELAIKLNRSVPRLIAKAQIAINFI